MRYEVDDLLYNSRDDAMKAMCSLWLSADGMNDAEDIQAALVYPRACAQEMVAAWGCDEDESGQLVEAKSLDLGRGVQRADEEEIADYLLQTADELLEELSQ